MEIGSMNDRDIGLCAELADELVRCGIPRGAHSRSALWTILCNQRNVPHAPLLDIVSVHDIALTLIGATENC
jgi:hypothetical protein